jgi:hypothetical protein
MGRLWARPAIRGTLMQGDDNSNGEAPIAPARPVARARSSALPERIQAQIGHRLAAIYDEVLLQPIPDRFHLLLDELERGAPSSKPPAREKGRKR